MMAHRKNYGGIKIRKTVSERIFDVFNTMLMIYVCFITIYPFINTLAISFNEGPDAMRGGIYFLPRVFTLKNYAEVFADSTIIRAYAVTITRTVLGVIVSLLATGMMAYGLSKPNIVFKKIYMLICVIGMIFNAGLIPTYMLYRDTGLLNNFAVYILPSAVSIWNMILMKTFFESLPEELEQSAMIDGASTFQVFFRISIPISMPIIATICIFNGVYQWNSWFDAYMFMTRKPDLHPVQTYLYKVIALSQATSTNAADAELLERRKVNVTTIRAATVVITVLPVTFIYSIFQKHFIQGIMVGSLKS
jgi:putative aldouronate transport system permease protein